MNPSANALRPETRRQIYMPDSWQDELSPDAPQGEKRKFPRAVVDDVLTELCGYLDPRPVHGCANARCRRMCAVGGYRRRKVEMKDLELLYIPRVMEIPDSGDLFSTPRPVDVTDQVIEGLVFQGVLAKRLKCNGSVSAWGPWNKHAVHVASGLPIDLFVATAENYFNRLVVTTGPMELNIRIASEARRLGWEWEVNSPGFVPLGSTWEDATKERRTMRCELDVFQFVGMPLLRPEARR